MYEQKCVCSFRPFPTNLLTLLSSIAMFYCLSLLGLSFLNYLPLFPSSPTHSYPSVVLFVFLLSCECVCVCSLNQVVFHPPNFFRTRYSFWVFQAMAETAIFVKHPANYTYIRIYTGNKTINYVFTQQKTFIFYIIHSKGIFYYAFYFGLVPASRQSS